MTLRNSVFLVCLCIISVRANNLYQASDLPTVATIGGKVPQEILRTIEYVKSLGAPEKESKPFGRKKTINTSILLYGPPGTGKTTLAQLIAGETECAFFSINIQRLYDNYLGTASKTIEDVFNAARSLDKPAVIFCDEIDTLCHDGDRKQRSDEVNTAFDTLLIEIEKCNKSKDRSIIFIAATNRIHAIDPAVVSRLGTKIAIGLPDLEQRYHVFRQYLKEKNIPLCRCVVAEIAQEMEGFSNRDIVNYIDYVNGTPVDTLKAVHFRQAFIKFKKEHEVLNKDPEKTKNQVSTLGTCINWGRQAIGVAQLALSGWWIFNGVKTIQINK